MKKRAANTFIKGLNTDRHPLSVADDELVDARNTDITAVSKGYQFILQKREGNDIVTKQVANSGTWVADTTYTSGIYILYLGTVYKSLQAANLGNTPATSPTWWEVQPEVSAGLPDGYIPLALQEFNNVAYIISVNPSTGKTQLGTFPCPDYSQFVYVSGEPIANAIGTITHEYREDQDQVDFAFTTNSTSYVGTAVIDPVYNEATEVLIQGPAVKVTNTGLSNITINIGLPSNIVAIVSGVNVGTYITLAPGASNTLQFATVNSFNGYTAEEVREVIIVLSSVDVSYSRTYTFDFKVRPAIFARDDNGNYYNSITFAYMKPGSPIVDGTITTIGDGSAGTVYEQNFETVSITSTISYSDPSLWYPLGSILATPVYDMAGSSLTCTVVKYDVLGISTHASVSFAHVLPSGTVFNFSVGIYVDAF